MPVEVELKARVRDREAVERWLGQQAQPEVSTYRDTYYDFPDRRLQLAGRQEMRLRQAQTDHGSHNIMTFKGAALDEASVPELETAVSDIDTAHEILSALGLRPTIRYTKECSNYRFDVDGRHVVATMVEVPELDGTFIEVETVVPDDEDRATARALIAHVLAMLGLGDDDLDSTYYIDLVRAARGA